MTARAEDWQVYLLECADGTYYCGCTCHMERRLAQHNGSLPGGAKYTRTRRPVRLLATRRCVGRAEAQRQEALVKRLPRARKPAFFAATDAAPGNRYVPRRDLAAPAQAHSPVAT